MNEQQQRVAVVSGASAGIGKAAAVALAAQGWRVIGIGRDPERSAAAEAEIRAAAASGAAVHFIRADFAMMGEVMRAAAEIAAATSRLDVLINNAGGVRVIGVSSTGHEYCPGFDWDDLQMLGRFTASGAYCQAKLANILFTRELARRAAADGIVAQVMHPGVVASNFASHGDASGRLI